MRQLLVSIMTCGVVIAVCHGALLAEEMSGDYRSPPAGTVLKYPDGEIKVTRVSGIKAYHKIIDQKNDITTNNVLIYHGMMSNWLLRGEGYLKFKKSGFRSPWPLRVHGRYKAKFSRNTFANSQLEGQVVRTEEINVPAGRYFTYVLSGVETLNFSGRKYSQKITRWYAPRIGVFVRTDTHITDGPQAGEKDSQELLEIRYPSGYEEPKRVTKAKDNVVPKSNPEDRLKELKQIYDEGLIDEAEYNTKRREIDGGNVTSLQGKLKLLKNLFEEGLIDQAEYNSKKAELLEDL